jgi:hypothetical protein
MSAQPQPAPVLAWHRDFPGCTFTSCGVVLLNDKVVKQLLNKCTGYMRVTLRDRGGRTGRRLVHRLVLEAFVGFAPAALPLACHRNDVKRDNRIENLYWGDRKANADDAAKNGRTGAGINGSAKLTWVQAAAIRSEYTKGSITMLALADRYGITQGHVSEICSGKKWRNVA